MFTHLSKLKKSKGEPTELENGIAQALFDLEVNTNVPISHLYFCSAKEVTVGPDSSAIVVVVPYRLLTGFQKVQGRVVHELEKKFSGKHVIIIGQRRIVRKPSRNNTIKMQKRPYSRTLKAVHEALLDDTVYPAEISGRRDYFATDGAQIIKIYLDKKDQATMEHKLNTFAAVYKKLTGKDARFSFAGVDDRSF
eukprot:TRINITY_DN1286_c0_g1_i1.p2 TRINITY_DN1286_c0_g1~~TRINITY_DN1286_c0_g1_i1.p2  ORF type:complete len:194 (-),score=78.29 TRINITY_DN1286_c0_g1_i1:50-631(-)